MSSRPQVHVGMQSSLQFLKVHLLMSHVVFDWMGLKKGLLFSSSTKCNKNIDWFIKQDNNEAGQEDTGV